jgi:hypothetical protein
MRWHQPWDWRGRLERETGEGDWRGRLEREIWSAHRERRRLGLGPGIAAREGVFEAFARRIAHLTIKAHAEAPHHGERSPLALSVPATTTSKSFRKAVPIAV